MWCWAIVLVFYGCLRPGSRRCFTTHDNIAREEPELTCTCVGWTQMFLESSQVGSTGSSCAETCATSRPCEQVKLRCCLEADWSECSLAGTSSGRRSCTQMRCDCDGNGDDHAYNTRTRTTRSRCSLT